MAATSYDVFISHAGDVKEQAFLLSSAISNAGGHLAANVFVDEKSLRSGDYAHGIMQAAARSAHLTVGVVVLSPSFIGKYWPRQELQWLLANFEARKHTAAPLHLLPVFLKTTHDMCLDAAYIQQCIDAAASACGTQQPTASTEATITDPTGTGGGQAPADQEYPPEDLETWKQLLSNLVQHTGRRRDHVAKESLSLLADAVADDVLRLLQQRLALLPLPSLAQSLDELVAPLIERVTAVAGAHPAVTGDGDGAPLLPGAAVLATTIVSHGMGGSGKTTQAVRVFNDQGIRSMYNKMCFVEVKRNPDVISLQAQLLSKLCGLSNQNFYNPLEGLAALRRHLAGIRAFIVLDDVWDQAVLDKLVVEMAPGSCIFVTSRFQLKATHTVPVALLDSDAATALFCATAGLQSDDANNTAGLKKVVEQCGRLPLALKTMGSLVHQRYIAKNRYPSVAHAFEHLSDQLAHVGKVMNDDGLLSSLRISYLSLDEDFENPGAQEMFVNIGIYCKENTWRGIVQWHCEVLGRPRFDVQVQLELLRDLHLVEISETGVVSLHDQLEALAKNLCTGFLQRNPTAPDRMFLHGEQSEEDHDKLERIVRRKGDFLQQLLQLTWEELPEGHKSTASSIIRRASELQILRLDESTARSLDLKFPAASDDEDAPLGRLKLLSLQSCAYLARLTLDGSSLAKLRVLDCSGCCMLSSLDGLGIAGCTALETLNLTGCISLHQLPQDLGKLRSLKRLLLNSTSVSQLPASTTQLTQLQELRVACCPDLNQMPDGFFQSCTKLEILELRASGFQGLPPDVKYLQHLKYLIFTDMHHVKHLPEELGQLSSLEALYLGMNEGLQGLPASFTRLERLRYLDHFQTPKMKLTAEQQAFVDALDRGYASVIGWLWLERAASTSSMVKALLHYKEFDKDLISNMLRVLYLMVNNEDNRWAIIQPGGLVPLFEMWLHPQQGNDKAYVDATLSNMGVSHARHIFRAAVEFCLARPAEEGQCCRMNALLPLHQTMRSRTYDPQFCGPEYRKIWPALLEYMEEQVAACGSSSEGGSSCAAQGVALCSKCREELQLWG